MTITPKVLYVKTIARKKQKVYREEKNHMMMRGTIVVAS